MGIPIALRDVSRRILGLLARFQGFYKTLLNDAAYCITTVVDKWSCLIKTGLAARGERTPINIERVRGFCGSLTLILSVYRCISTDSLLFYSSLYWLFCLQCQCTGSVPGCKGRWWMPLPECHYKGRMYTCNRQALAQQPFPMGISPSLGCRWASAI